MLAAPDDRSARTKSATLVQTNDALPGPNWKGDCTSNLGRGNAMKLIRPQLLQVACVAVVALGVNAPSWGAEPNVVGNWKLVSFATEELTTGKKTPLLGEHPMGYLIYTPQGRMMGLIVHETRSPPKVDE